MLCRRPTYASHSPPSMLESTSFLKSSQWATLHREDAAFLVDPARREQRERDWSDAFTPDEHFVANELHQAGRQFSWQDVTKVSNMTCSGHPMTHACNSAREIEDFERFAVDAAAEGKVFARKVGWRCAQQASAAWLRRWHRSRASEL